MTAAAVAVVLWLGHSRSSVWAAQWWLPPCLSRCVGIHFKVQHMQQFGVNLLWQLRWFKLICLQRLPQRLLLQLLKSSMTFFS
jgi:hypothetical protein